MGTWRDPDNWADNDGGDGLLDGGGLLGWLGRNARRSTSRRARRWLYWKVPFVGQWLRYRQSGPLGRVGCVIQLLIQVAIFTVVVLVVLQLLNNTDLLQSWLAQFQSAIP
ncbi:MAG: hypothetical protein Kow0077_20250 [Anaerolineae bacterium]